MASPIMPLSLCLHPNLHSAAAPPPPSISHPPSPPTPPPPSHTPKSMEMSSLYCRRSENKHFVLQMVRETEMAAKVRPSSSQTPSARPSTVPASTIPAWLADEDLKPSSRARAAAQRSHGSNACSSSKSRKASGARSDVASSPGYHKLSLDLMKSMSGKSRHQLLAVRSITWAAATYCCHAQCKCVDEKVGISFGL